LVNAEGLAAWFARAEANATGLRQHLDDLRREIDSTDAGERSGPRPRVPVAQSVPDRVTA